MSILLFFPLSLMSPLYYSYRPLQAPTLRKPKKNRKTYVHWNTRIRAAASGCSVAA